MRNRNSPVMNSTNHHWQYGTSAGGNSSSHHNQVWILFSLNRYLSNMKNLVLSKYQLQNLTFISKITKQCH